MVKCKINYSKTCDSKNCRNTLAYVIANNEANIFYIDLRCEQIFAKCSHTPVNSFETKNLELKYGAAILNSKSATP